MGNTAVIGLGSNLGVRADNLKVALQSLAHLPDTAVTRGSHIYITQPLGYEDQPPFYNACLMLDTTLSPHALLGACLGIEAAMGRERFLRNGPRIIDLDVLLYEGVRDDSFELTLPHPRILERAFVMVPLLELYPSGRAPGLYFGPRLRELGIEGIECLADEMRVEL